MALPSACRQRTGRSGAATAAPVAIGSPMPMAPPVSVSQSWRGAPAVAAGTKRPEVFPSSTTTAPSGSVAPTAAAIVSAVMAPVGRSGRPDGAGTAAVARRAQRLGQRLQGARGVLAGAGQRVHGASRRDQVARLVGVGEEGHRRLGVDQHEMPDPVELGLRHLGQVGQPVHRRDARAPLEVGREGLTQEKRPRRRRHPAGRLQPVGPQRAPAEQERGALATAQRLRHLRQWCRPAPRWTAPAAGAGRDPWPTPTRTRPPAGPAWPRSPGARARRPRRRRRRRPRHRRAPSSGTTPTPAWRWTRCPTARERRSGRGTSHGRPRC